MARWVVCILLLLVAAEVGIPAPAGPAMGEAEMPALVGDAADELAAIDAHALDAPEWATSCLTTLSAYLTMPNRDERERARAIFRWITANIAYDAAARDDSLDPEAVLRNRRAVCHGYAVLFAAVAESAGMNAEVIVGHSKKFQPAAYADAEPWLNHSWNAVEIDGEWQLVDCCWGAGYLDEHGRFVQRFTPHYFLAAPEVFVCDHLPADPKWQLVESPIPEQEYLQLVQVRPPFFDCGLRLVSHLSGRIDADGSVAVTIDAPPETLLLASLYRDGRELEERFAFTERDGQSFVTHARFPSAGTYVLRMFARRADAGGDEFAWVLDYTVNATSAEGGGGFPKTYSPFLARSCRLEGALSQTLRAGEVVDFALTVPTARDVAVLTSESFVRLAGDGSRFTGTVPVAAGPVVVFARFDGAPTYEGLLQYVAQ